MKKTIILILILFVVFTINTIAQGNLGIGTATPHSSALLDITSISKGLLIPRMTQSQRDSISAPEESLLIFNVTSNCIETWILGWQKIWCYDSTSCKCCDSFIDTRDSNIYHYVQIGSQIWMCENLKYLPSVVGPATGSNTMPYYYVYGYNGTDVDSAKATSNYNTYGVLYNWPAAMAGSGSSIANPSGVQGVCPSGWHLPSDEEWDQLVNYLGGEIVAGGKLKATGTVEAGTGLWYVPNAGATNETGFTALPGGFRTEAGSFLWIGHYGFMWSTTECQDYLSEAFGREPSYSHIFILRVQGKKGLGALVRCLRD